jgi:hypothetical protein
LASIAFYDDVGTGAELSGLVEARSRLRELATRLKAFSETRPIWTHVLRRLGFGPDEAAGALIGFSNSLTNIDGSKMKFRVAVERALKLPLSYKPPR